MIKRSITFIIFALFTLFAFSQTVNIKYKDGRTDRYKLSDIESLYFQGNNNSQGGDDTPQGNNEDEAERIGNDKTYGLLTLTVNGAPYYVWNYSTIGQKKDEGWMGFNIYISEKAPSSSMKELIMKIRPSKVSQLHVGDFFYKDDIYVYSYGSVASLNLKGYIIESGSISIKRIGEYDLTIQFNDLKFKYKGSGVETIISGTAKLVHSLTKNGERLPFSYVD